MTTISEPSLPGKKRSKDSSSETIGRLLERVKALNMSIIRKGDEKLPNLDEFACELEGVRVILEVIVHLCGQQTRNLSAENPSDLSEIKEFFTSLDLGHLFSMFKLSLQFIVQTAELSSQGTSAFNIADSSFRKLVQLCGLLYSISDLIHIPLALCQFFIFLVSIPWLSKCDPPWFDLPHGFGLSLDGMVRVGRSLDPLLGKDSRVGCLQLLAVLDAAPTWRTQVFLLVLKDTNDMKIVALKYFPLLLSSIGSYAFHLINNVLPGMLSCGEAVQVEIAKTIGSLACVLTENTVIKKLKNELPFQHSISSSIACLCPDCDSINQNKADDLEGTKPHAIVNAGNFIPYLQLISPEASSSVKCAFIKSMKRIFAHLAVTPDNEAQRSIVSATCFDLIEDPDFDVRMQFSNVVPYVVKPGGADSDESTQQNFISKLKKVFVEASSQGNCKLQETVVLTIGQLGKVAEGELLLVVIVSLLESLTAHTRLIRAAAFKQVQEVAKFQNKQLKDLFAGFKQPICKFVVDAMDEMQNLNPSSKGSLDVVSEVASVFEFRDVHSFLKSTLRFVIPYLVKKASPSSSAILRHIAKELKMNRREMLLENFKFIFSFLVRTCSASELEKALGYVQKETDVELGSLLRSEAQSVYNQLLLYLSVSYSKVFSGLAMLASKDDTYTGPKDLKTDLHLANFLQSRLLGILAFYNTVLLTNTDLEEKRLALQSLTKLMQVMGRKYITYVRVKVMGILRLCLRFQDEGFPELSCDAWENFVRNLELSNLGHMLSQIIVTLLPYLNKLPARVTQIFHFLIVENKAALRGYFHEIYFLPDIPELRRVNAVLRTCSGNSMEKMDFRAQLRQSLKGISHESADVQRHALSKLKQLLHDNQATLHGYVLSNETVDPIIPQLISVLMSSCRVTDAEVKILVAECLGELGAVDPGRLDKLTHDPVDEQTVFEVAYMHGDFESKKDGDGYDLWQKFPEHIQEVLRPHLYSKYLSSSTPNWSGLLKPIYRSTKGRVYNEWVSTWTSYMITKVKGQKPSHIFQACSKIFKHDVKTALFLLPHVLLYVLLDGTKEDVEEVYGEIMAVLTHLQRNEELPAPSSDFRQMSAQTIFSALDYLNRWARAKAYRLAVKTQLVTSKHRNSSSISDIQDEQKAVEKFLEKIPQDVLAYASFHCKAYARALMHFEAFISSQKQDVHQHLGFVQKLYIVLDEPDGVAGVAASRKQEPTLHEQILDQKSSGKLCDVSARYERAIQEEPGEIGHHKGLLQCFIDLGQVTTALTHVDGVVTRRPEWEKSLNAYRVEASWRLGQWDSLESYLKLERGVGDWDVGLGRILLAAKEKNENEFRRQLKVVRSQQMGFLSAASMESGSYQRGYEHIVRLHMLREVEEAVQRNFLLEADGIQTMGVTNSWQSRLHISQTSFRTREPILNLRRVVLKLLPSSEELQKEQGKSWLQSAKAARVAGHVQTADSSLLSASAFALPSLCIERAKWMASQGDVHSALISLQRAVSEQWPDGSSTISDGGMDRFIHAKALLLIGRWMEETAHYAANRAIQQYKTSMLTLHVNHSPSRDFIPFVLKHYGLSLQFGNKFIYQSMPRLLSIWLNFGATVSDQGRQTKASDRGGKRQKLADCNEIMSDLTNKLPAYQFLTAFSLLISRICHANQTVFLQLEEIIAKLLVTYPQQAMWMMMAVSKEENFSTDLGSSRDITLNKFLEHSTRLADRLLEVCNKEVSIKGPSKDKLSMSHDFSVLKRLVSDGDFSPIIVPLQSAMTVTLPSGAGSHHDHNPFPGSLPCIVGFEDKVDVLASLQKPKKITIKGSDGNSYTMMCKPKDDLRKDCRTMEFNALINKCLRKDPESRRRQLHIRTYAVIPLNEECGLLEWVQNTHGLRNILTKIYKEKNMYTRGGELKKLMDRAGSKPEDKKRVFLNEILPRHPSVFHEWFLKTFPNPTSWYMSRLTYCRTSAVMCMVGHILGLGDRHGENILFDATSGDCVHVDFNCLFKKGESFECPERVPFRLTHNIVNAMGPLGYEGVFRRSCEVTLRLLRNQCDSLLTVLRTFIYDPLVEWQRTKGRELLTEASKNRETGEVTNEEGLKILKDVERRIKGFEGTSKIMIPLSIEGQVHYLIEEATSDDNLCRMYIGWAPFL
ncbi:serine/threonine-protein kinase ATR-like [Stylophora pistillata]|uniref:serine/threonine-protein kinase ATR-like n=1 Tax=Stylophora pistillata TaxID=50429 RepID=UPI000C054B74|nr:serine/threonine-protein kinase ATR-like [Stylophora pistillata]